MSLNGHRPLLQFWAGFSQDVFGLSAGVVAFYWYQLVVQLLAKAVMPGSVILLGLFKLPCMVVQEDWLEIMRDVYWFGHAEGLLEQLDGDICLKVRPLQGEACRLLWMTPRK